MGSLPPLQVTVDAKGWSVILDVRLALDRRGPMLALRLAEELRVFLVPSLWEVLDNTIYYEDNPDRITEDPLGGKALFSAASDALKQWESARLELGLSSLCVSWVGDALHESCLPKDIDAGMPARFQFLAYALARRLAKARPELDAGWPLLDGARDVAALAAAMVRYRPIILTLTDGRREAPGLCRLLSACNIPCNEVAPEQSSYAKAYLNPILARSGAMELMWDGLQLAAVHLVPPRTLTLPPADADEAEPAITLDGSDSWEHAAAYWYSLP